MEQLIELIDLSKDYLMDGGRIRIKALEKINIKIGKGEFVALMGASGSGKTTLLNVIGGMLKADNGYVLIDGVNLTHLTDKQLVDYRTEKIGYIYQSFNLLSNLTAFENIELPLIFHGRPREERIKRVNELTELVGISKRKEHKPNELSGGEKQRVAIARAMANKPKMILADEPTGNVDIQTAKQIVDLLQEINENEGTTFILSTHDLKMVDICKRVLWISDGQITRDQKITRIKDQVFEIAHTEEVEIK